MRERGIHPLSMGSSLLLIIGFFLPLLEGCGQEMTAMDIAMREEFSFPRNLFFYFPLIAALVVLLSGGLMKGGRSLLRSLIATCLSLLTAGLSFIITFGCAYDLQANEALKPSVSLFLTILLTVIPLLFGSVFAYLFWKKPSYISIIGASHAIVAIGLVLSVLVIMVVTMAEQWRMLSGTWVGLVAGSILCAGAIFQMKGDKR